MFIKIWMMCNDVADILKLLVDRQEQTMDNKAKVNFVEEPSNPKVEEGGSNTLPIILIVAGVLTLVGCIFLIIGNAV